MSAPMEPEKAAEVIEKWISFYGMDNPKAWPSEDYAYVKRACEAMRRAIDFLKGQNETLTTKEIEDIAQILKDWPRMHSMNNPKMWEKETYPFVRSSLHALMFTVSYLQEHQANQ